MITKKIHKTRKQIISSIANGFLATLSFYVIKSKAFITLKQKIFGSRKLVAIENSDQLSSRKSVSNRCEILLQLMHENKALWL